MKKQTKPRAGIKTKNQSLTFDEFDLIWKILDKFNILLLRNVFQFTTTELTEELDAALKLRLIKEAKPFTARTYEETDLKLNRYFFQDLHQLLRRFIYLNGLGVDMDKRRAEILLRSIQSLEKYYI